jgi:hypothetical protein
MEDKTMVKLNLTVGRLYWGFRLDGKGVRVYYGANPEENATPNATPEKDAKKSNRGQRTYIGRIIRIGIIVGLTLFLDALVRVL